MRAPALLTIAAVFAFAFAFAFAQPQHASGIAWAQRAEPVLHELIPPDPGEDLAMGVTLDGDLPPALGTPGGLVSAPDPRALPAASEATYASTGAHDVFRPDLDTRLPDVPAYDDPFTPPTAPFKRMEAFDAVREDYALYVRDARLTALPLGTTPGRDDQAFYEDVVVDATPDHPVRIPSVGPGARVVHARLGIGAESLPFRLERDGADDWFLQLTASRRPVRARLVMEVVAPRAAFGGEYGNPSWGELPPVPALPDNVTRDAAQVRAAIGVSRAMRPRDALAKLVQYFRSFTDSDVPPSGHGDVYLDLALSKKGVCRHRAFAFLVTAQSVGIPTRVVENEAHAWVEVHDGRIWRRVDLGGAGRMPDAGDGAARAAYEPPREMFPWPEGAGSGSGSAPGSVSASGSASVSVSVDDPEPHRGLPLHVHGTVRAGDAPCAHAAVEIALRDAAGSRTVRLGTLATGDDGTFAGALVVPESATLGPYDVVARSHASDARCASGGTE